MSEKILIVDDEKDIRMMLAGLLADEGYETAEAADSDTALSVFNELQPDLVLLDIWLEGSKIDGIGILEKIKKGDKGDMPVVMMSGHGTIETAVSSIKIGAYDFIEKPFKVDRLLLVVKRALENISLKKENIELRNKIFGEGEFVGSSTVIQNLRLTLEKAAPARARVFITGESGAGKELAAKKIHMMSNRRNFPFIVVNCAALTENGGLEEIFGMEKNGKIIRSGLLEKADGGTILFDEINEMPLNVQNRMVKMLQEESFERVGGVHKITSDVRIVSSATKDVATEIGRGKLKEDLFYRLNVIHIDIPSLNSRREDIVPLVEYFMQRVAADKNLSDVPKFSKDAMALLEAYDWRGNVRQLKNVLEWVLIINPENVTMIKENMLPFEINLKTPDSLMWNRANSIMSLPLKEARDVFEKEYIDAQLKRFNDNVTKAAVFMGMERSALYRKLKALGMDKPKRA